MSPRPSSCHVKSILALPV
uniref:Uncharacterized protein n=1 Tax=Anguilla anguilla TaxID=7936 RepID=A0A0E9T0S4_ANGAN